MFERNDYRIREEWRPLMPVRYEALDPETGELLFRGREEEPGCLAGCLMFFVRLGVRLVHRVFPVVLYRMRFSLVTPEQEILYSIRIPFPLFIFVKPIRVFDAENNLVGYFRLRNFREFALFQVRKIRDLPGKFIKAVMRDRVAVDAEAIEAAVGESGGNNPALAPVAHVLNQELAEIYDAQDNLLAVFHFRDFQSVLAPPDQPDRPLVKVTWRYPGVIRFLLTRMEYDMHFSDDLPADHILRPLAFALIFWFDTLMDRFILKRFI